MKRSLLTVLLACAAVAVFAAEIPGITSKSFEQMDKNGVKVILFTAGYCAPCKQLKKDILDPLSDKYAGNARVKFYTLDVEHEEAKSDGTYLQDNWGVNALPTLVITRNGAKVYARRGYSSAQRDAYQKELEEKIASSL